MTGGRLGTGLPTEWVPEDSSLIAWTADPTLCTGTSTFASGDVNLASFVLRKRATLSTIAYAQIAAAITPTAGANFAGLYDASGNLLASVGIDAQVASGSTMQLCPITPQTVNAGRFYIAMLFSAATVNTIMKPNGVFATAANYGLPASTPRAVRAATGQATLPASLTLASGLVDKGFWAAVS